MSSKQDSIQFRFARQDDLAEICHLLEPDHMNDGVHILRLVHTTSQPIFYLAVNEANKIIAVGAEQKMDFPEGVVFFGLVKRIEPAYRGLGISDRISEVFQKHPEFCNMLINALTKAPHRKKIGAKIPVYTGRPTTAHLARFPDHNETDCTIGVIDYNNDIDLLLAYDRTIFDYDRSRFMREWSNPSSTNEPYVQTVVAKQGQEVVGFGTLRLFSQSYSVQPLYANNDGIAMAIMKELIRLYTSERDQKPVEIMFFATNSTMLRFVREANFEYYYCSVRVYFDCVGQSSQAAEAVEKYIKKDRVYCMQYYWPA